MYDQKKGIITQAAFQALVKLLEGPSEGQIKDQGLSASSCHTNRSSSKEGSGCRSFRQACSLRLVAQLALFGKLVAGDLLLGVLFKLHTGPIIGSCKGKIGNVYGSRGGTPSTLQN